MYFDMVPAECMALVMVSCVYMRLVAECLVQVGYILLVPASFAHNSCCIWLRNLFVDHPPCALRVLILAIVTQTSSCS
jgi:hypothetical protein